MPSSPFELPFKVNRHPQMKMNSSSLSLSGGLPFLKSPQHFSSLKTPPGLYSRPHSYPWWDTWAWGCLFLSCPLRGLSVPLQTMCTSNSSLSSRNFVCVSFDFAQDHELVEWDLFEAAYRLVFVRPALAWRHRNLSLFLGYFRALASITNLCMPGLGQGHGKKRHPHAHSPGNFKELKCYKFPYSSRARSLSIFIDKYSFLF